MKIILKKPWISPRGKFYPSGTIFTSKNIQVDNGLCSKWYDFYIPSGSYGFVLVSDNVFKIPTKEEKIIREKSRQLRDAHIKSTADPLTKNRK